MKGGAHSMLSPKQNFLETIKPDGKPDRLVNQYEATKYFRGCPLAKYIQGDRYPGMPMMQDRWGVSFVWGEGDVSAMPYITDKTKVIRDVTSWRDFVKIPDLLADCSDLERWIPYLEQTAQVDRDEKLLMWCAPTGLFERLHFLMGFEDTLLNFLVEPEAMEDLCAAVAEYRYAGMKLAVDIVKPDVVISQDDWGRKDALFMSPEIWRQFIKPGYKKCYGYIKEKGIVLMHHADSFMEPLVEDMVELGIDVWQGVLPQNDIVKLQKQLNGRMALMGGIDSGIVDRADSTEAEIRAETRRACETYGVNGHFIPSVTYGGPSTLHPHAYGIISDEIDRYNAEHY